MLNRFSAYFLIGSVRVVLLAVIVNSKYFPIRILYSIVFIAILKAQLVILLPPMFSSISG